VVAAIYALFLGLLYRELTWPHLLRAMRETVGTTAAIGLIVAAASLSSWILARERVPQQVAELMLAFGADATGFLLALNALLLALGCVMEATAIMILVVPVILPAAMALGIDPTHLGVVVVLNLMIGLLTPPFGVGLFTVAKVGNIPFSQLARASLPFLPPLLLVLLIVTLVPASVTWLPNLAFGPGR
jgi:tripartite ATP-independent transporter DctM subunit